MPVVARVDPKAVFTPEEWSRLTSRSSLRGMWLVIHAWGTIAAAIALVALWPNPLTWLIAVTVVGARQLGLAILMHEAAHGGLHANRAINEWVGQWLCAVPVGADLASYRSYHLQHHKFTQQPEDPDLSLSAPFPITKESYTRKAIRDLTGQTFVKQRLPLFLSLFRRNNADDPVSHESFVSSGADKMARFLAVNAVMFGLFWLAGARRASSVHVSAVLSAARIASALDREGPDRTDGNAPRISRRDAAGYFKSAGLTASCFGWAVRAASRRRLRLAQFEPRANAHCGAPPQVRNNDTLPEHKRFLLKLTDLGGHLNDAAGGLCYPVQLPGEQNDCLQYKLDKEKCSFVEIIQHTRAVERADRGLRIPDDPLAGARTRPACVRHSAFPGCSDRRRLGPQ